MLPLSRERTVAMPAEIDMRVVGRFTCAEPSGPVRRTVYWAETSLEFRSWLVDQLQYVPSPFCNAPGATLEDVDRVLTDPHDLYLVDEVGILLVMPDGRQGLHVHVCFWDRRLRGRERLCWTMLQYIQQPSTKRIYTVLPSSAIAVRAFALRVGFRISGYVVNGTTDSRGRVDDALILDWHGGSMLHRATPGVSHGR